MKIGVGSDDIVAVIYGLPSEDVPDLLKLKDGVYNNGNSGCLIGPTFAKDHNLKVGSRISIGTNGDKGTLTAVERISTQGKTPRFFGLDPTGAWLIAANQDSNTCAVCHAPSFCTDCHASTVSTRVEIKFPEAVHRQFIHRDDFLSRHAIEANADPALCLPGETPLACEVRVHHPSIAIVSEEFGYDGRTTENYVQYMRAILDFLIS